jgi:hypothetical protein
MRRHRSKFSPNVDFRLRLDGLIIVMRKPAEKRRETAILPLLH